MYGRTANMLRFLPGQLQNNDAPLRKNSIGKPGARTRLAYRLSKKPIIKQKRIEAHGTKASLV